MFSIKQLDADVILALADMAEIVPVVEEAFADFSAGKTIMPEKMYLELPQFNGDFRAMPCYSERHQLAGIKWVNVHPDNVRKNLPSVMAMMFVNDPETGKPKAILDATTITFLRTGAAGGVATKYFARKDVNQIGFVGAGVQAFHQFSAHNVVLSNLESVHIYDPSTLAAQAFEQFVKQFFSGEIIVHPNLEACVRSSEVITTTTPVRSPIIKSEWVQNGTHINAIGADAPGKQELETALLTRASVFVDDIEQASHSGEINVPISEGVFSREMVRAGIGDVILGKKIGRRSDDEITIFDSTGLAVQDLALAGYLLQKSA